jgi:mitosis inhibitor protein kinase SWE1
VETPEYKQAKPFQAAFMSTGLVSKMNRNPDLGPSNHPGVSAVAMPDTPCKKQSYNASTYPPKHTSGGRHSRVSLGSPSSPFSSVAAPAAEKLFGTQNKSGGLFFQQIRSGHTRKASVLSIDGDELLGSQDDLPPTPTKNLFFKSIPASSQGGQATNGSRAFVLGSEAAATDSQSGPVQGSSTNDEQGGAQQLSDAAARPSTPYSTGSPSLGFSISSLAGNRPHNAAFATPAPTRVSPAFCATVSNVGNKYVETDSAAVASPLNNENLSPHTPQDAADEPMGPPNPGSLSFSNAQVASAKQSRPPATPTTSHARHSFLSFAERRLSITPQNGHGPGDVDESLLNRFDKAEIIGKGEFSQVYRVVKSSEPSSLMTVFSMTPRTPSSPENAGAVYAVKKLKVPFHSAKAREAKLQEVAILQALSNSSKVVQFIDAWEYHGHLYIQTEYCAEGSLDRFLGKVGQTGRLDDFRIWKILLETAQVSLNN